MPWGRSAVRLCISLDKPETQTVEGTSRSLGVGILDLYAGLDLLGIWNAIPHLWLRLLELPWPDLVRWRIRDVVHL